MNRDPLPPPTTDDRLSRAIGYSVAFHVVLFIAFGVKAFFFSTEPLILENSIRVDMVALPDKGIKQAPAAKAEVAEAPKPAEPEPPKPEVKPEPPKPEPPPPAPAPKKEVAKPEPKAPSKPEPLVTKKTDAPAVNLKKTKQEQEAALKRLEALERLERSMKESSKSTASANSKPSSGTAAAAPIKGNKVSAGTSLTGVERLEHQSYLRDAYDRVKSQWNLPRWLSNANLSAKVRLFIDESGVVTRKEIIRSSNNSVFDERVIAAIESSSPLPAPPSGLASRIAAEGIELEFVPE